MSKKTLLPLIISLPLICAIAVSTYVISEFRAPYSGGDTKFTIRPGQSFANINYQLKKRKIILNPHLFHYYTKYTNRLENMKAGTYKIPNGVHMSEVLTILTTGTPELTRLTIPEGKNIYEIGKLLEKKGISIIVFPNSINGCGVGLEAHFLFEPI